MSCPSRTWEQLRIYSWLAPSFLRIAVDDHAFWQGPTFPSVLYPCFTHTRRCILVHSLRCCGFRTLRLDCHDGHSGTQEGVLRVRCSVCGTELGGRGGRCPNNGLPWHNKVHKERHQRRGWGGPVKHWDWGTAGTHLGQSFIAFFDGFLEHPCERCGIVTTNGKCEYCHRDRLAQEM